MWPCPGKMAAAPLRLSQGSGQEPGTPSQGQTAPAERPPCTLLQWRWAASSCEGQAAEGSGEPALLALNEKSGVLSYRQGTRVCVCVRGAHTDDGCHTSMASLPLGCCPGLES